MPIYEYRCGTCVHTFDVLKKMSDPAEEACPACRGDAQRLVSAPIPTRKVRDACLAPAMPRCGPSGSG